MEVVAVTECPGLRVLGYARVSTTEQGQHGAGLPAQESAIRVACEQRQWSLVDLIADAGASGKDLKRAGVREAIDRLGQGEADVLLVSKLDRLSRSLLDFTSLMAVAQRKG